jgi:hypothetical protein
LGAAPSVQGAQTGAAAHGCEGEGAAAPVCRPPCAALAAGEGVSAPSAAAGRRPLPCNFYTRQSSRPKDNQLVPAAADGWLPSSRLVTRPCIMAATSINGLWRVSAATRRATVGHAAALCVKAGYGVGARRPQGHTQQTAAGPSRRHHKAPLAQAAFLALGGGDATVAAARLTGTPPPRPFAVRLAAVRRWPSCRYACRALKTAPKKRNTPAAGAVVRCRGIVHHTQVVEGRNSTMVKQ